MFATTMSKRPAASAQSGRAQRPRYLPPNQPDLPEIPGVPPDLTPLLVESLRSATNFFQHATTPFQQENDNNEQTQQQSSSIVDSILNRMASSDEEKSIRKRRERMEEDRQSWLNAVKRKAKECHNGGSNTVPLSCFRYLWDLGQQHTRVAVRRASLNLCGSLLLKSSECRIYVSSDETLFTWVTCVVEAKNVKASSEKQVSCWQAEALEWLRHLSEAHGDLYPKLRVAQQFLQQRCSSLINIVTEGNSGATMPDLRRIRDIAMKYGDREIEKVDKLIHRAHKCLDVLVPRMGLTVERDEREATVPMDSAVTPAADDDSDDDDIEWEDADEEFEEKAGEDHTKAVERTLAAMASYGGLQGGHIEINLESKEDEDESPEAMDETAVELLQKTVQSIEARHMKRLSSWVDAMIKADGLVLNEKSLVIVSADVAQKRGDLLHKLLDRKQALANILASAAKLGITVDSGAHVAPSDDAPQAAAASNVLPPRQSALLATAARRRYDNKRARRRSNKLQIKFRTS